MPCPLYQSRVAFVRDVLWLDVGSRRFLGAYQKATPPLPRDPKRGPWPVPRNVPVYVLHLGLRCIT